MRRNKKIARDMLNLNRDYDAHQRVIKHLILMGRWHKMLIYKTKKISRQSLKEFVDKQEQENDVKII